MNMPASQSAHVAVLLVGATVPGAADRFAAGAREAAQRYQGYPPSHETNNPNTTKATNANGATIEMAPSFPFFNGSPLFDSLGDIPHYPLDRAGSMVSVQRSFPEPAGSFSDLRHGAAGHACADDGHVDSIG